MEITKEETIQEELDPLDAYMAEISDKVNPIKEKVMYFFKSGTSDLLIYFLNKFFRI